MRIKVRFHGVLSDWVGSRQAEIDLPDGATLSDLLAEIKRAYGRNMPRQLWNKDQKAFNKAVLAIGTNGKPLDPVTRLKNGEEVKFLLVLAGG
jgi:molybdopterin converting factor small subunit